MNELMDQLWNRIMEAGELANDIQETAGLPEMQAAVDHLRAAREQVAEAQAVYNEED